MLLDAVRCGRGVKDPASGYWSSIAHRSNSSSLHALGYILRPVTSSTSRRQICIVFAATHRANSIIVMLA